MIPFFFATIGRTDLQVVLEVSGRYQRFSLESYSTRAFHQACLDGTISFKLLSFPETLEIEECADSFLKFQPENKVISPSQENPLLPTIDLSGEERVLLCSKLLAEACNEIRDKQKIGELGKALKAILFISRRSRAEDPGWAEEPIAVFHVVQQKGGELARELGIQDREVQEFPFIEKGNIFSHFSGGAKFVRLDVAQGIFDFVKQIKKNLSTETLAVISNVGGISDINHLITESVFYWFGVPNVRFVRPIKDRRTLEKENELIQPPQEILNVRRRIKEMIQIHSFEGAAFLAKSFENNLSSSKRCLTSFFERFFQFFEEGSWGPDPKIHSHTRSILERLRDGGPSLRIALRVEEALQRNNLTQALYQTFAFATVAAWECICQSLRKQDVLIDWKENSFIPSRVKDWKEIQEKIEREGVSIARLNPQKRQRIPNIPLSTLLVNEKKKLFHSKAF